jgi:hypothetical protein
MKNTVHPAPAWATMVLLAAGFLNGSSARAHATCDQKVIADTTCAEVQGHWVCPVSLSKNASGAPAVAPFTLRAKAGTSMILVWRIVDDSNAKFQAGDGPEWLDLNPSEQAAISESWATTDPNGFGFPSTGPAKYFRVRLSAQPMPTNQQWKYNIKYHDGSGNQVVCDPYINNTGP